MKYLLPILFCVLNVDGYACQCGPHPFNEGVTSADRIFQGIVISKDNSVYPNKYELIPTINWKGKKEDTIEVFTGSGGGDCGFPFEIGEEYIVYSSYDRVSRCGRTAHIGKSFDKERLDLLFLHAENLPAYTLLDNQLSDYETEWLSHQLREETGIVDTITDRRMIFIIYDKCMSKPALFDNTPEYIRIIRYLSYKQILLRYKSESYGLIIANEYKKRSDKYYVRKAQKYLRR